MGLVWKLSILSHFAEKMRDGPYFAVLTGPAVVENAAIVFDQNTEAGIIVRAIDMGLCRGGTRPVTPMPLDSDPGRVSAERSMDFAMDIPVGITQICHYVRDRGVENPIRP